MKIFLKTEDEIELMRRANRLVGKTLGELAKHIKPGVTTLQLDAIAEEFIRDHSDGGIRPDDVARHLGISRRLLDLRFRAITGKTVLEAIQEEQLNRVRDLLRTTSLTITEISNRCNFRSENHLKRLFKSAFGTTMRDYRKAAETT